MQTTFRRRLIGAGVRHHPVCEAAHFPLLVELVAAGPGVTIIPQAIAERAGLRNARIEQVDFSRGDLSRRAAVTSAIAARLSPAIHRHRGEDDDPHGEHTAQPDGIGCGRVLAPSTVHAASVRRGDRAVQHPSELRFSDEIAQQARPVRQNGCTTGPSARIDTVHSSVSTARYFAAVTHRRKDHRTVSRVASGTLSVLLALGAALSVVGAPAATAQGAAVPTSVATEGTVSHGTPGTIAFEATLRDDGGAGLANQPVGFTLVLDGRPLCEAVTDGAGVAGCSIPITSEVVLTGVQVDGYVAAFPGSETHQAADALGKASWADR
ncbi:hypothetical protein CFN78_19160 [Amycolatopsis antarctica]|uniref:Uncharacterized protein n=1 Tax=Amycolatopsis antarctica TaxID=1854586 RepID=A0A263CZV9_9PSEU|nr:hypothetical protein [Amycolatopsis antarctica]OZM71641.1 hypothetical protein CFN78_19160 [Amycolatopsis antarctica]